jgi:DNA-binding GntR family transcriptional regulator
VSALRQANEIIFAELQNRIINLELEPGTVINEKALMEEFDVSRTPVREALIKLSQIGLIETRPRVGTFVTQIDIKSVKNAYEVKKNLEGLAAELAAKRATDDEIKELFEIIERFKGYDIVKDYKLCIQDDQRFHYLIRQAARNEILIEVLDMLNTKTARFLQSIHYVISDYDWFSNSLKDIANAIHARDADEARKHTEIHTKEFLDQMSRHFFG